MHIIKPLLYFTLYLPLCLSLLTPQNFLQEITALMPPTFKVFNFDIGRTVNRRAIMLYGITANQQIPANATFQQFSQYQSALLNANMLQKHEEAVKLLYIYLERLNESYQKDKQIEWVLKNKVIWMIPFVNIDGYEDYEDGNKKNRNFGSKQPCEYGKYRGVNLDYNFFWNTINLTKDSDQCHQLYNGPKSYSQKETQAFDKLFNTLDKIKVVIDIRKGFYRWEVQKDEGFSEWAISRRADSYRSTITLQNQDQNNQTIKKRVEDFLVKALNATKSLAPVYKVYRYHQNKSIYIKSLSVDKFTLRCDIVLSSGAATTRTIQIPRFYNYAQQIALDFQGEHLTKEQQQYKQIVLSVEGLQFNKTVQFDKLQNISWYEIRSKEIDPVQLFRSIFLYMFAFFLVLGIAVVCCQTGKSSREYTYIGQ